MTYWFEKKIVNSLGSWVEKNFPLIWILSILSVSSVLWQKCQGGSHPVALEPMQEMLGDLIVLSDCLILTPMNNARGNCGSPEMQGSQSNPQRNWKLENICYKTNYDLCRIPRHVTQGLVWFSGTPGLRPAASGQVPDKPPSALGTMSQYFAHIFICITISFWMV